MENPTKKRTATRELNHDNWNDEDEPEGNCKIHSHYLKLLLHICCFFFLKTPALVNKLQKT